MGVRKNFFDRMFTLSINCRDVFDSRKWESYTEGDTFSRHQVNRRRSRTVRFTLTWNFGSNKSKKKPQRQEQEDDENSGSMDGYDM